MPAGRGRPGGEERRDLIDLLFLWEDLSSLTAHCASQTANTHRTVNDLHDTNNNYMMGQY